MRYKSVSALVDRVLSDKKKLNSAQFRKIKIKRLLILFWGRLGEATLSTMLIQVLRRRYRRAYISYGIGKGGTEILKNDLNINKLIPANVKVYKKLSKERQYDLAIDLYGGSASRLMVYLSGAKYCIFSSKPYRGEYPYFTRGIKLIRYKNNNIKDHFLNIVRLLGINIKNTDDVKPILSITKKEKLFATRYLKKLNISSDDFLVGLQPTRHYEIWPEFKYAQLGELLIKKLKAKVLIFHGPGEMTSARRLHSFMAKQSVLLPYFRMRDYFAILSKCKLFITTIGGAAHVGPALNTPTVILLSPTQDSYWIPNYKKSFYLPIISKTTINYQIHRLLNRRSYLTIPVKKVFDFITMQKNIMFKAS